MSLGRVISLRTNGFGHNPLYGSIRSQCSRFVSSSTATEDIRSWLKDDLKAAMRAKDTVTSTTIRSLLAEVTNLEKAKGLSAVDDGSVFGLLRKALARREEAAAQFIAASRHDLAEKETAEMSILSKYLPPPLSEAQVEDAMKKAIESTIASFAAPSTDANAKAKGPNPQAIVGRAVKAFWSNVHPSLVGSIPSETLIKKAKDVLEKSTTQSL